MQHIVKLAKLYRLCAECTPEFKYHVINDIGLEKNIFRPGSKKFFDLFKELKKLVNSGSYHPNDDESFYLSTDLGEFADFDGKLVPLDFPFQSDEDEDEDEGDINDAKYQGKDVELNKPKRGGSKKFYVYVKDGDKVKKVSFGDPGMSMKISDPEARSSFKARHKCETKNDKTTAGYWSCRIARYPNLTGAKSKYTWW